MNHAKVMTREFLARIKSIIDLYIINKQPKYTGQAEPIKFDQNEK